MVKKELESALAKLTDAVMGRDGIVGTAIGETDGRPCLKVYLSDEGGKRHVPTTLGGFPVVTELSGPFKER